MKKPPAIAVMSHLYVNQKHGSITQSYSSNNVTILQCRQIIYRQ